MIRRPMAGLKKVRRHGCRRAPSKAKTTDTAPHDAIVGAAASVRNDTAEGKRLFTLQAKFALLGAELVPLASGGLVVTTVGCTRHLDSLDAAQKLLGPTLDLSAAIISVLRMNAPARTTDAAPGLAAPELDQHAVVELAPPGTTGAAPAGLSPPQKDECPGLGGDGALREQSKADTADCALPTAKCKPLSTLRARLALDDGDAAALTSTPDATKQGDRPGSLQFNCCSCGQGRGLVCLTCRRWAQHARMVSARRQQFAKIGGH